MQYDCILMVCKNSNPLFRVPNQTNVLRCALVHISICKEFVQVRLLRIEESKHCCFHSILLWRIMSVVLLEFRFLLIRPSARNKHIALQSWINVLPS